MIGETLIVLRCTFTARNGGKIGWKAGRGPEDILAAADDEVELILANLEH
jgi:hypothetical protein